jgi:hypothetical protein
MHQHWRAGYYDAVRTLRPPRRPSIEGFDQCTPLARPANHPTDVAMQSRQGLKRETRRIPSDFNAQIPGARSTAALPHVVALASSEFWLDAQFAKTFTSGAPTGVLARSYQTIISQMILD